MSPAVGRVLGLTSVLTVRNGSSIGPSRHTTLPALKEACHGGMFDMTPGTIGGIADHGGKSIGAVPVIRHEEVEPDSRLCRETPR